MADSAQHVLNRRGLWGGAVLALGVVLLSLAGCKDKPVTEDAIRPVRTLVLQASAVDLVGEFPAEIKPRVESGLGFRVGGKIIERKVQAGQEVKRGQVLARLDASDLRLNENASKAQLNAVDVDRKQKQADLKRYEELRQKGFISAAEFEARRSAAEAAQAQYDQARAGLAVQTNQADYAVLVANADGVVTGVDAEVGQVVAAGQSVIRVAGSSEKEAAFQIPENRVDPVRKLQQGEVTLWSGGPSLQGRLREVSGSADPATRTFAGRLSLIDAPASVRFGMTATVRFSSRSAQPLVRVPLSALLNQEEKTWVWVVAPDTLTVHRTQVSLATVTDSEALLDASLPNGAEIVTAGIHRLREGQKVRRLEALESATSEGAAAPVTGAASGLPPAPVGVNAGGAAR
jgi:RND family efflux transporter MFP subunit